MDNINEDTMMTVVSVLGEKISTLRAEMAAEASSNRNLINHLEEENERLHQEYADLHAKLGTAQQELAKHRVQSPKEKADAYMAEKGQYNLYSDGIGINHIDNVKKVRAMTGWVLKESKDYCDDWMCDHGFYQNPEYRWVRAVPVLTSTESDLAATVGTSPIA